jgi:conjugative transfer signal peptidase TraF
MMRTKGEWWVLAAILVVAVAAPFLTKHSGLRFNDTDSLPMGFYRTTPGPSPFVGVCLPNAIVQRAIVAGLLLPHGGECPNGHVPILKKLYRATGDHPILFDARGFHIAGRLVRNTAPKEKSKTGVPLQHQPFGTYGNGLWVFSDHNPDSFDSRYFGPVNEASIRYYAVPFVLF